MRTAPTWSPSDSADWWTNPKRPGTADARAFLQDRQVPIELPARDLDPVVLPLLALDLDVAVEHVLAERAEHELRLRGELDRLAEGLGQLLDALALSLVGRQVVEVALHRLGGLVALLDPLEPGLEQDGERQGGVAGRGGAPGLPAGCP